MHTRSQTLAPGYVFMSAWEVHTIRLSGGKDSVHALRDTFGMATEGFLSMIAAASMIELFREVSHYRNRWKGHGGRLGPLEAQRRLGILMDALSRYRSFVQDWYAELLLFLPRAMTNLGEAVRTATFTSSSATARPSSLVHRAHHRRLEAARVDGGEAGQSVETLSAKPWNVTQLAPRCRSTPACALRRRSRRRSSRPCARPRRRSARTCGSAPPRGCAGRRAGRARRSREQQDRVADQLARAVIRDVAAALDLEDRDVAGASTFSLARAAAERDDVRDARRGAACPRSRRAAARATSSLLQRPDLAVLARAEIDRARAG